MINDNKKPRSVAGLRLFICLLVGRCGCLEALQRINTLREDRLETFSVLTASAARLAT